MIYKIFKNTLLTIFAAAVLVPSSIVVLGSFKKDVEIYTKPLALPETWNLDNFRTLIESGSVLTPFKNSVIVAVFSVFFTILFASLVAYAIARSVTLSGKALFALFALGLAIPGQVNIIPIFTLFTKLGLNNSLFDMRMALILGFVGYLFRRFGVPNTPLVLGVILGPVLEIQFRQAIQLSNGDYSILLAGLLPKAIYLGLVLVIFLPNVINLFKKRATKVQS